MRGYRLIMELEEVHDLELELLSVLIIIGVRSGKEMEEEIHIAVSIKRQPVDGRLDSI